MISLNLPKIVTGIDGKKIFLDRWILNAALIRMTFDATVHCGCNNEEKSKLHPVANRRPAGNT